MSVWGRRPSSAWFVEPVRPQPKHKVFISYCHRDQPLVDAFVHKWADEEGVFTPKILGISDKDDFVHSTKPDYVMSRIRELYLGDSTVTLVLLGTCTHSRRYVDWELKTSLRQGEKFTPNGVMGILLGMQGIHLPDRFAANYSQAVPCYARYYWLPKSADELRGWIEDAYQARTGRCKLISNSADMMKHNARCRVCGVAH